ncbi:MAG: hypothetical protein HRT77_16110 [Halioglobus sp.]|nr:hypothetical protein [Halioglobus sp.]
MSRAKRLVARYRGQGAAGSLERRIELVVMVLALLLLVQLAYGAMRLAMLAQPEPVALDGAAMQGMRLLAVKRVTDEQRNAISERPLFSVSRRPPVSRAQARPAPAGQLRGVQLLGVFGSGSAAGVIVQVDKDRQRVLLGDALQGWTLDAVHPDRVEFVRRGQQTTLPLQQRQRKAQRRPASPGKAATGARDAHKQDAAPAQLGFGGR